MSYNSLMNPQAACNIKTRLFDRKIGDRNTPLLVIFLSPMFLSQAFAGDVSLPVEIPRDGRTSLALYFIGWAG